MSDHDGILVTGASGFIGARLVERLRAQGRRVHALVRDGVREERLRAFGCELFRGDVTLADSLTPAVAGCAIVVHGARGGSDWRDSRQVNVLGTMNVLRAAQAAGVRRVVHLSSLVAHGRRWPTVLTEDFPLEFRGDAYAVTKAESEQAVREFARATGLEVAIVRPTIVYGPGSARILADLDRVRYERAKLVGHGRGLLNMVYVDDLVEGLCGAAFAPGAAGEAFLLSGDHPVTVGAYFGALARMCRKPTPPRIGRLRARLEIACSRWHFRLTRRPRRLQEEDLELMGHRETVSVEKARRLLGFAPRVSLGEGMERVEQWLRSAGHLPGAACA